MDEKELEAIIVQGETQNAEFKSWLKAKNQKERIALASKELVAFANYKGGTLYFGIEDDGQVTGCGKNPDLQNIIEGIHDMTRPEMFPESKELIYKGQIVIALSIEKHSEYHSLSNGKSFKRLGKNSKPFYLNQINSIYNTKQSTDFSAKIIEDSFNEDINFLEVYKLKEKLKNKDSESSLPNLEDLAFLKDLGLVKTLNKEEKLTIAGLLFVGKESAIKRLLPQAEVIYLHYDSKNLEEYDARIDMKLPIISILDRLKEKIQNENKIVNVQVGLFRLEVKSFPENVFQEALLNALVHREYQSNGSIYVKHYSDKIIIENPGGFLDDISENNIITHQSLPRNKLIAETLQRLNYVQRSGQGVDIIFRAMISTGRPYPEYNVYDDSVALTLRSVIEDVHFVRFIAKVQDDLLINFSLPELMILRYLSDNKKIKLSECEKMTQTNDRDSKHSLSNLVKLGLIESVGKEYVLTAKVYSAIKTDVEYTQDKVVQYLRAKDLILEYLKDQSSINIATVRELCRFDKSQAAYILKKMRKLGILEMQGKSIATKYVLKQ